MSKKIKVLYELIDKPKTGAIYSINDLTKQILIIKFEPGTNTQTQTIYKKK